MVAAVVVSVGCAPNESCDAAAAETVNEELVALVRLGEVAVTVKDPEVVVLQPLNVAMPLTAFTGFVVQEKFGAVLVRLTGAVEDVTVLPPESWTATTGWPARLAPAVDADGEVVNPSLAALPKMTTADGGETF